MPDVSIGEFIAFLSEAPHRVSEQARDALERAAQVVEGEAKSEIGHYQGSAGPFTGWAELADSTKDERVRLGYSENDPLLRDGTMRDSIGHEVEMTGLGEGQAVIGSASQIAEYQELGTDRIPPRSFLGGGLIRREAEVVELIGSDVAWALSGGPLQGKLSKP
jgi:hypothetical protein